MMSGADLSKLLTVKQEANQSVMDYVKYFKKLLSATQATFTEQVKIRRFDVDFMLWRTALQF